MTFSKSFERLTVVDVVERQRKDNGEKFPVALIAGVTLDISATTGNSAIRRRQVSVPLNGFSLSEAEAMFPVGMVMPSQYRIERYEVEPYDWTTPDGELRENETIRYRLTDKPIGAPSPAEQEPTSTVEPATPTVSRSASGAVPPTEVGE